MNDCETKIKMGRPKFSREDIEYIYNLLREGTVKWSGRAECLRLARRKKLVRRAKNGNPVYKYFWQCAKCSRWFRNEADMEVDHKVEIGGVSSFNGDWNEMIFKIMPRPVADHLQTLCIPCHMRKTRNFMNAAVQWTRKTK